MRSLPWVREDLISEIRSDVWRYLTPAASIERELLEAAALLRLRPRELRAVGRLQFLISDELGALLKQLPTLARRLATTTANEEEWSVERVRGSIQWGRTIGMRQATGLPHLYVTAPARRAYQTPENELLVLVLDAVLGLARQAGWHRSTSEGAVQLVSARVAEAERWLQMRALLEVERRPITPNKLARVRSGRHKTKYREVIAAYERFRLLADKLDRAAIRAAVETYGLVSRDDATLFELVCTFRVLAALSAQGWNLSRLGLFQGSLRIEGQRGSAKVEVSYQRTPRLLSTPSDYRSTQQAHGIKPGGLRPDLVIRTSGGGQTRWLIVEAKGGAKRRVVDSARAAAYDLFAYRTAFAEKLGAQSGVYGLGIAWGAGLEPSYSTGVSLCTPDTLASALSVLVS